MTLNVLLLVLYLSTAIQVDCQFSDEESHLLLTNSCLLSFSHKQNSPPESNYLLRIVTFTVLFALYIINETLALPVIQEALADSEEEEEIVFQQGPSFIREK